MAYFSNGTEGERFDRLCTNCVHGWNYATDEPKFCPVNELQQEWNYEQHDRKNDELTEAAAIKNRALRMLVPDTKKVLCAMFLKLRPR